MRASNSVVRAVGFVALLLALGCGDDGGGEESGACEIEKSDADGTKLQCIDNYLGSACGAVPTGVFSGGSCASLGYTHECVSLGASLANGREQIIYGRSDSDC